MPSVWNSLTFSFRPLIVLSDDHSVISRLQFVLRDVYHLFKSVEALLLICGYAGISQVKGDSHGLFARPSAPSFHIGILLSAFALTVPFPP